MRRFAQRHKIQALRTIYAQAGCYAPQGAYIEAYNVGTKPQLTVHASGRCSTRAQHPVLSVQLTTHYCDSHLNTAHQPKLQATVPNQCTGAPILHCYHRLYTLLHCLRPNPWSATHLSYAIYLLLWLSCNTVPNMPATGRLPLWPSSPCLVC